MVKIYSLYFHIPFCTKKCDYCHFYVIPDRNQLKALYMESLKKEWEMRKSLLPEKGLTSIYFGGGTPALLGPVAIETILSWISPPSEIEITLEANPENIAVESMRQFRNAGVNRVSIGIQTLDPKLLSLISRRHSAKCALTAVHNTFEAGFENISIDLMYDLPEQTLESWEETLSKAASLPIMHLSLYNLTIEPHTVFFKKKNSLLPLLPDETTSLEMLNIATKKLEKNGLKRYEISAFAKHNLVSQHNIGYWTNRPFFGFGPSAFSYWENRRFRNVANLHRWAKKVNEDDEPIDFQETLPEKERLKEQIAIGLRLLEGIPLSLWPQEFDKGLDQLISEGFLQKSKTHISLTQEGLLFHDTVAESIMAME